MISDIEYNYNKCRVSSPPIDYFDITNGTTWNKPDYPKIRKIYNLINHYIKRRDHIGKYLLINSFEQELDRYWNDQTTHTIPEPVDQTVKFDRVLNAGRTQAAMIVTGESGDLFDYLALGTSQTPVSDADYKLYDEILRVNVRQNGGYISAAGSVIKHSGLISPGETSMIIYEIGFVNLETYDPEQMMWNRTVFPVNKAVNHTQNQDFFSVTHSVYTSSSQ